VGRGCLRWTVGRGCMLSLHNLINCYNIVSRHLESRFSQVGVWSMHGSVAYLDRCPQDVVIHILFFIQTHFAAFLVFGVVLFGVVLECVVYAWLRGVEHN
jgi:hypothetical protein